MESIIRTIMEDFVVLRRFNDPRVDPDDALDHLNGVLYGLERSCSLETGAMLLRTSRQMADESRGGKDFERTMLLDSMGARLSLVSSEDGESFFEREPPPDRLEMSSAESIFRILVDDILFFFLCEVDEGYAFHQLQRISNCLHQQDPATIESFLAAARRVSDETPREPFVEQKELLEAMSLGLDFLPDPDPG